MPHPAAHLQDSTAADQAASLNLMAAEEAAEAGAHPQVHPQAKATAHPPALHQVKATAHHQAHHQANTVAAHQEEEAEGMLPHRAHPRTTAHQAGTKEVP